MAEIPQDPKKPFSRLTFDDAVQVWRLYKAGHYTQRIAAYFDTNVARVYDVLHGKLHPGSQMAALNSST